MGNKNILEFIYNGTIIKILKGDIVEQDTEAIVNAANSTLMGGGGVDGAIHRAGGPQILEECIEIRRKYGECPTGEAVITSGGNLKAKYVIHTVGPIWRGGNNNEPKLLENAYRNCLNLAYKSKITSVSFPSISTGTYRYPIDKASLVALRTVRNVLEELYFNEIRFVLFSQKDLDVYNKNVKNVFKTI